MWFVLALVHGSRNGRLQSEYVQALARWEHDYWRGKSCAAAVDELPDNSSVVRNFGLVLNPVVEAHT